MRVKRVTDTPARAASVLSESVASAAGRSVGASCGPGDLLRFGHLDHCARACLQSGLTRRFQPTIPDDYEIVSLVCRILDHGHVLQDAALPDGVCQLFDSVVVLPYVLRVLSELPDLDLFD